jgi:hypothetical protein
MHMMARRKESKVSMYLAIIMLVMGSLAASSWGMSMYDAGGPNKGMLLLLGVWYACILLTAVTVSAIRVRRRTTLVRVHRLMTWISALLVAMIGMLWLSWRFADTHGQLMATSIILLLFVFFTHITYRRLKTEVTQGLGMKDTRDRLRQLSFMQLFAVMLYMFVFAHLTMKLT